MGRSNQNRKGQAAGGINPSVAEAIRMNLSNLERASANGDRDTARRCLEASRKLFDGLGQAHDLNDAGEEGEEPLSEPNIMGRGYIGRAHGIELLSDERAVSRVTPLPQAQAPSQVLAEWQADVAALQKRLARLEGEEPAPLLTRADLTSIEGKFREVAAELVVSVAPIRPPIEGDWKLLFVLPWRWLCCAGRLLRAGKRAVFR